ncbi:MAG: hypothetical protein ABIH27_01890 [Candidatus Omnitrophota bacterium]
MKRNIIFLLFFLSLNIAGYCGQSSRIELTDGSVINGEIISFASGSYTINTVSLGEIKIAEARVAKIESVGPSVLNSPFDSGVQSNNFAASQINSYMQKLMSNPDNAAVVQNLATNPQVRELAEDPEIVNAIKSGNIQAVINNKKFTDLASSPELKEASKEIK